MLGPSFFFPPSPPSPAAAAAGVPAACVPPSGPASPPGPGSERPLFLVPESGTALLGPFGPGAFSAGAAEVPAAGADVGAFTPASVWIGCRACAGTSQHAAATPT